MKQVEFAPPTPSGLFRTNELHTNTTSALSSVGFAFTSTLVARSIILPKNEVVPYDADEYFSPREIREIERSLLDFAEGKYKKFEDTDDLFEYLDNE